MSIQKVAKRWTDVKPAEFGLVWPPKKALKGASMQMVFTSNSAPFIQTPPLPVAFDCRLKEKDPLSRDKCMLALSLDAGGPFTQAMRDIEAAIVQDFLDNREKQMPECRQSEEELRQAMLFGVRMPPPDHPEYSPTLRVHMRLKEVDGVGPILDVPIFGPERQCLTDVTCIAKGSSVIAQVVPRWLFWSRGMWGITWVPQKLLVLSFGAGISCDFLGEEDALPANNARAPKEEDATAPATDCSDTAIDAAAFDAIVEDAQSSLGDAEPPSKKPKLDPK